MQRHIYSFLFSHVGPCDSDVNYLLPPRPSPQTRYQFSNTDIDSEAVQSDGECNALAHNYALIYKQDLDKNIENLTQNCSLYYVNYKVAKSNAVMEVFIHMPALGQGFTLNMPVPKAKNS